MGRNGRETVHRHPDAVAYPGVRERRARRWCARTEGGHTRYRVESGEVRSRDVAGDGMLPSAVPAELGARPAKLATDPASGAPDLDAGGREFRDASPVGGAAALGPLSGRLDGTLPGKECRRCGRPMHRCQGRKAR